ncbi:MAG: endo alpha-1,4 polygalactosaminidase [Armatimonadetes bacterium]|nr:endo alpha-1,4 polygalactosaminidase [Armatimonadota bacterium]
MLKFKIFLKDYLIKFKKKWRFFILIIFFLSSCGGNNSLNIATSASETGNGTLTAEDNNISGTLQGAGSNNSPLNWNIKSFLYILQGYETTSLDIIGKTHFDLIIMDAYKTDTIPFSREEIFNLKNSSGGFKKVLAYMSIGEAESYRYYWKKDWKTGSPSYIGALNPDWPGNYKVKYWILGWKDIIMNDNQGDSRGYLDRILDAGFDGVYLDIVDAYEYWLDQGIENTDRLMVDFVKEISEYAKSRNPNFKIFSQNAQELYIHPDYLNAIDGIGREDTYYGYEEDDLATPPSVTLEIEKGLDVFKAAGKIVLSIDYAVTQAKIDDAYEKASLKGYIEFCTIRDLSRIPNNGHIPLN